ncbi:hypothetical protein ON010_g8932 [Phytophthora cinnamomi]|nr:hypothetical protein ON010_g8932 [Phytophthora cinnamomi]
MQTVAIPDQDSKSTRGRQSDDEGSSDALDLLEGVAKNTAVLSERQHLLVDFAQVPEMKKWISNPCTDNTLLSTNCVVQVAQSKNTEVIELLNQAITKAKTDWKKPNVDRTQLPRNVKPYATIVDVSRAFTLNEKQHLAVNLIGLSLLTRWRNIETLVYTGAKMKNGLRSDQLRMFRGGEGGDGKKSNNRCCASSVQKLGSFW